MSHLLKEFYGIEIEVMRRKQSCNDDGELKFRQEIVGGKLPQIGKELSVFKDQKKDGCP